MAVFAMNFCAARLITNAQRAASAVGPTSAETRVASKAAEEVKRLGKVSLWEVEILEAGIVFHSVSASSRSHCRNLGLSSLTVIGVSLGASGNDGFVPFFVAIIFHQLVEGAGLGARMALLEGYAIRKLLLGALFAVTTSVGIAIVRGRCAVHTPDPNH
jgi:zinc transporter 1/2/3